MVYSPTTRKNKKWTKYIEQQFSRLKHQETKEVIQERWDPNEVSPPVTRTHCLESFQALQLGEAARIKPDVLAEWRT